MSSQMSNETSGELLPRIMVYLLQLGVIRWEFLVEYMKPSMTFDNLYNEMAYLKYEFVYGTYDFSQQKIIWDILYHLNPKMTFSTLKWLFSSMSMS